MSPDNSWQEYARLEQERLEKTIAALKRVSSSTSTSEDADFLASELGITKHWRKTDGTICEG